METTVLRSDFALRKVANRYPLRRHITAFFAALLVIAMLALVVFGGIQIYSLLGLPEDQRELGVNRTIWMLGLVSSSLVLMSIFAVWELARRLSKPLRSLADEAGSIRDFDFSNAAAVHTGIEEVDELSIIMNEMKTTIRRFLEIGSSLTAERDLHSLLNRILREMVDVSRTIGGVIYLLEEDGKALRFEIGRHSGDQTFEALDEEYAMRVPLEIRNSIISDAALRRKIETRQVRLDEIKSVDRAVASKLGVKSEYVDLIAVPLLSPRGEALGMVMLVSESATAKTDTENVSGHLLALLKAIAGSAAIALENQQLLMAQKNLMDSLIKLVASAIDRKSPHTGGHCTRVPALAKMLAEAAVKQNYGPFANVRLTDQEWESLELASWLHDCGKVTTPEYVVDKATKLETLYNRIHEIRTRFEVVKRENEIKLLREFLKGGASLRDIEKRIVDFNAEIDQEYALVAEANIGGEGMAPDVIEKIKAVAANRTWTRTLDDRIGISHEEMTRLKAAPPQTLPVVESVLADKPEHIVIREERDQMPADNAWGFKLRVPSHKFNLGELHNLGIQRGTLTDEERYIINDHIVQTIIMLESLPFPRHLRNVPEIAGGHHERMDGNGYPRRLMGKDMSVLARIMAIADVFEALTAGDRPYKKAKPLSEAIKIMGAFKRNGHLDPDLLDLFLESNVWMDYSYRFLNPEQMDEPDIRTALSIRPASEVIGPRAGNMAHMDTPRRIA
jgi:HD-GYP domain-containing protein (c-di-GMP phosphodiesterase class II)